MSKSANSNPFAGAPVVYSYTRAQAIEDGVLIDVSETAKEAGFKVPTVISQAVHSSVVVPPEIAAERGESEAGRLWDVLWMASLAVRRAAREANDKSDEVRFEVLVTDRNGNKMIRNLYVKSHGGDAGEHVLTIMVEGED